MDRAAMIGQNSEHNTPNHRSTVQCAELHLIQHQGYILNDEQPA